MGADQLGAGARRDRRQARPTSATARGRRHSPRSAAPTRARATGRAGASRATSGRRTSSARAATAASASSSPRRPCTAGTRSTRRPTPGVTKCVVIWGSNPAESSPPSWERLKDCQAQGAKLIVIDPRVTKTAARADLHLPVRPRTDGALALGLVHVMIAEDIYDKRVRRRVVPRLRRGEGGRRRVDAGEDRGDHGRLGRPRRRRRADVRDEHPGPDRVRRRADAARRGQPPARPCSGARSCARSAATSTCRAASRSATRTTRASSRGTRPSASSGSSTTRCARARA